ncbi:PREDICTED: uncharacterized protein C1orf100 homolog isoform X2 [Crocodylus porosus]|nr:PREDICTED: uncharacterized protein C1orf100 homolog isoform X2 [Crocodylus porosus]
MFFIILSRDTMSGSASAIKLRQFVDPAPILPPGTAIRQGKDVQGFYPGQLGRVHEMHTPEKSLGPLKALHPAPVEHEVETQSHHTFDNLTLKRYIHFQRTMKKKGSDWYNQTTYKEAFELPFYDTGLQSSKMQTWTNNSQNQYLKKLTGSFKSLNFNPSCAMDKHTPETDPRPLSNLEKCCQCKTPSF